MFFFCFFILKLNRVQRRIFWWWMKHSFDEPIEGQHSINLLQKYRVTGLLPKIFIHKYKFYCLFHFSRSFSE